MSRLCSQLSETAPTWGRLVAPWAEYVARSLCSTTPQRKTPATRLTQRHKREAKGAPSLPRPIAPPRRENICRGCGKTIRDGRTNCAQCAIDGATKRLVDWREMDVIGREVLKSRPSDRSLNVATRLPNIPGSHRASPLGSRAKCSLNKSSRYSRTLQPLRFVHELMSRAGTRARSDEATARISAIGSLWHNLLGLTLIRLRLHH